MIPPATVVAAEDISKRVFRVRRTLQLREVDGERIILDKASGKVHVLNATAAYVWSCLDGSRSVAEVSKLIANRFEIDMTTADRDIARIVLEFEALGLVQSGMEE